LRNNTNLGLIAAAAAATTKPPPGTTPSTSNCGVPAIPPTNVGNVTGTQKEERIVGGVEANPHSW